MADRDPAEVEARLRRHLRAAASVNDQLHEQLRHNPPARRSGAADAWLRQLEAAGRPAEPPFLVRAEDGMVYLVEGEARRLVRSGLLADLLERELGPRRRASEAEVAGWSEGPAVEVYEAAKGAPFVVVGGVRRPLRGLPLPYPVDATAALGFPEGRDLVVRAARAPEPAAWDLPLPTFLIIGAQKSATRWLRSNLGRHPEIYAAPSEIEFFNNDERYAELGLEWYRRQFAGWNGERVVGEATPGYMMWRHHPEVMSRRIQDTLPDVRLVAILRNPVDRAQSALVHHQKRERLPADLRLVDLVRSSHPEDDLLGLVAGGWYAASLRPYVRRFGDRLLVLLHDDLSTDALGLYRKVLAHLGVSTDFVPPGLDQVRFSNRVPDEEDGERDLTDDERLEVYELYRDDIARLQDMLGRDLSAWAPAGSGG